MLQKRIFTFFCFGALLALLAASLPMSSSAAKISPRSMLTEDTFGYNFDDTIAYNWIPGTTQSSLQGDDQFTIADIGFAFPFYENVYTQLYFNTNGLITFGEGTTSFDDKPIPSVDGPENLIAAFWDDLEVGAGFNTGAIYTLQGGVKPNRYFVVEWRNVTLHLFPLPPEAPFSFEAILYEGGDIVIQYASPLPPSYRMTIGIENSFDPGTVGVQYFRRASLSDPTLTGGQVAPNAILFTGPPIISGNTAGVSDVTITHNDTGTRTTTTDTDGDYSFLVKKTWTDSVTPSKECYAFVPANRGYTNVLTDQTGQNYTPSVEPPCSTMTVSVAGVAEGSYLLAPNQNTRQTYSGVNNGAVKLESTNTVPIIGSQRVVFGSVSYSELMGYPTGQLTTEYIFPYYNNVAFDSQLRVGNLGAVPTTITVTLGGTQIDSYSLGAGLSKRKNYPGQNSGPLRVSSSATDILATTRVLYGSLSYSELMGYPTDQLTTEYIFPYYNNVAFDSQLRVSNLGGVPTTITVTLGTTVIDTYILGAGGATRKNYAGKNSGPLRVSSSATDIISTIRVLYNTNSYSELMGYPVDQLVDEYWYPVYDNAQLDSQLRVSNVGTGSTTITVYSAGTQIDTYLLAAGAATRKNYVGQNNGPLHVVSSAEPILSTVRTLYNTPSFSSYYEMTGFPNNQLALVYWFPWYNNVAFNSQVRMAVP